MQNIGRIETTHIMMKIGKKKGLRNGIKMNLEVPKTVNMSKLEHMRRGSK